MNQSSDDQTKGILISSGGDTTIGGDIVGRDKITNNYFLESSGENRAGAIASVIRNIQAALYDDNSRLPYALTLCFDLCSLAKLQGEYPRWLAKELSGFNYRSFEAEFDNTDLFEAWMKRWGSHRFIETYVKFGYRSTEDGQYRTDKLTYKKIFLAFPLAEIVRSIDAAKTNGMPELFVELRALGEDHFSELQGFVSRLKPRMEVPPDLRLFYRVAALEQVLNDIRSKVLALINDARQQQTR